MNYLRSRVGIVILTVREYQLHVFGKLRGSLVVASLQVLLHRSQVHRRVDDLMVVRMVYAIHRLSVFHSKSQKLTIHKQRHFVSLDYKRTTCLKSHLNGAESSHCHKISKSCRQATLQSWLNLCVLCVLGLLCLVEVDRVGLCALVDGLLMSSSTSTSVSDE